MCVYQGNAQLFDGIEFNPELSNCDVWADFAFFIMDLLFRGRTEEAALVWNHYLQQTDDFEGFKLLDLYVSYRAAVRCRVSCLALEATESQDQYKKVSDQAIKYLNLALTSLESGEKKIIAVGGLSGTGKSTLSSILAQRLSAVHICSDATRKHLCGVSLTKQAPADAYSEEMNKKTYQGLLERAEHVLDSGRTVVVDAVFHSPIWRNEIEAFANELKVPFFGIWCEVSPKVMMERVRMRGRGISDANESVIALQETYELGKITWQHLDTSLNEEQTIMKAMNWLL